MAPRHLWLQAPELLDHLLGSLALFGGGDQRFRPSRVLGILNVPSQLPFCLGSIALPPTGTCYSFRSLLSSYPPLRSGKSRWLPGRTSVERGPFVYRVFGWGRMMLSS